MTTEMLGHLTHLTVKVLQLGFCLTIGLDSLEQVWDEFMKLFERVEIPLAPAQVSGVRDPCTIEALTLSELQWQHSPQGPVHRPIALVPSARSSCQTHKRGLQPARTTPQAVECHGQQEVRCR